MRNRAGRGMTVPTLNTATYSISVSVSAQYEKLYIGLLLVLADNKIVFIGPYRYRPIQKKTLSFAP